MGRKEPTKKAMTKESLKERDTEDLIAAYNNYLEDNNSCDDEIYLPDDFEEILSYFNGFELLNKASYGDYNPQAYAYGFDGYANIKSYITEQDVRNEILGDDDFVQVAEKYL